MIQKTNEQGQKVYEVLSEEYIRLKECELKVLKTKSNVAFLMSKDFFNELQEQIKELESHIEDLKAEL